MDDLDRVYQRLVHSIRQRNPEYLTIPFSLQELYEELIPYRHHRRELGIETNQDYEVAVSRLLAGERGYVQGNPAMQERIAKELESPSGEPGLFRDYASEKITLAPDPLKSLGLEPNVQKHKTPAGDANRVARTGEYSATLAAQAAAETETASPDDELEGSPRSCRFCGGKLPEGRSVTYCPHCGQNLSVKHCPACGTELEKDWRFCVTCGRSTS